MNLPKWVMGFFIVLLLVGFPIAVIFAWIFDASEKGIIKTKKSGKPQSSEKPVKEAERKYFPILFRFRKIFQEHTPYNPLGKEFTVAIREVDENIDEMLEAWKGKENNA